MDRSSITFHDTLGPTLAYEYGLIVKDAFDKGIEDKMSPRVMLHPDGKNYLGDILEQPRFRRTCNEKLADMMKDIEFQAAGAAEDLEEGSGKPPAPSPPTPREPDDTMDPFMLERLQQLPGETH